MGWMGAVAVVLSPWTFAVILTIDWLTTELIKAFFGPYVLACSGLFGGYKLSAHAQHKLEQRSIPFSETPDSK